MPTVGVPLGECRAADYERLLPGSRVEYRGVLWRVVGMYFAADPEGARNGNDPAAPGVPGRTKYLILRSLDLAPRGLQADPGATSSS